MQKFDLQLFSLQTYDPKKVIVIFGGAEIHGFAEDSILTIKPLGEGIKSVVGCDGEVVRTISCDDRHEVTINLSQGSSGNDILTAIYARDRTVGDGVLPLVVKDLSGRTTYLGTQSWIERQPEIKRGKDAKNGENEWVFQSAVGILYVGGHD